MIRIDGFLLDCATSETVVYEADVTDHPVEKGSDVTDNMRVRPVQYTVEGIVSDTPIGVVKFEADRQGNATPSITGYQKLTQIQALKKLVTLVSDKYGSFANMALTSLTAPYTKETGRALMFTAVFRAFVIVDNNRANVRVAVGNQGAQTQLGAKQAAQVFPDRIYVTKGPVSFRAQLTQLNGAPPFWTSLVDGGTDYYRVNYAGGQHADGFLTPLQTQSGQSYQYTPLGDSYSSSSSSWVSPSTGLPTTQSPGATGGNNSWNQIMKGLNS